MAFGEAMHLVAPESVVVTPDGRTCVTGSFTGSLNLGAGISLISRTNDVLDGFLFCLDAQGKPLFLRSIGDGVNKQFPYYLSAFAEDDLLLTGMVSGTVNLGKNDFTTHGPDVVVTRLNEGGRALWVRYFGDDSPQQMGLVSVVTPEGNSIVAGQAAGQIDFGLGPIASAGEMDIFIVALGPEGQTLWGKMAGSAKKDQVNALALGPSGTIALAGEHFGALNLGGAELVGSADVSQGYLEVLDRDGAVLFGKAFSAGPGGSGHSSVEAVGFDGQGRIFVAGVFAQEMTLDGISIKSAPRKETGFIAQLNATGKAEMVKALGSKVVRGHVLNDGSSWLSTYEDGKEGLGRIGNVDVPSGAGLMLLSATGEHVEGLYYGRANPNALFADERALAVAGDLVGEVSFGKSTLKPAGKRQSGFVARLK